MLIFVSVGLASSGGTVPLQALPGALRWLAEIKPLRQILASTRAILYFDAQADAPPQGPGNVRASQQGPGNVGQQTEPGGQP